MVPITVRRWFAGPWIQWAIARRNSMSGVSELGRHDANASSVPPRCATFVLRSEPRSVLGSWVGARRLFHLSLCF